MRKFLMLSALFLAGIAMFAAEERLVSYVPSDTNVIFYLNTQRLLDTELIKEVRAQDVHLDNVIDGIQYHESKLGIDDAVRAVLVCRETSKAITSFYIVHTVVPEEKFGEVFVADYAFFNTIEEKEISLRTGQRPVTYYEMTRKRTPGKRYGAYYVTPNVITIFHIENENDDSEVKEIINTMRRRIPVRGEVAKALETMNTDAIAGLVAGLRRRGQESVYDGWDPRFDGVEFVEITFDLVGEEQQDIYVLARFYCKGLPMIGGATVRGESPAATFISTLRGERDAWLMDRYPGEYSEAREAIGKCIELTLSDHRVGLEIKMPAAVYRELRKEHPTIATDMLTMVTDVFQLSDSVVSHSPAVQAAPQVSPVDLF